MGTEPASVVRVRPYENGIEMSEPEGKVIEALRRWDDAQDSPDLRHNPQAWETLQLMAGLDAPMQENYLKGFDL